MFSFNTREKIVKLPCYSEYMVDKFGNIYSGDMMQLSLSDFNKQTGLSITDPFVLSIIAFQDFKWAPIYWNKLVVRKPYPEATNIEDMLLGVDEPVMDYSIPGFYLIPYFSGYVVNKNGKILKLSTKTFVQASKTDNGYWSARLKSDDDVTANRLTHRIVAMAFISYPHDFMFMEVNHLNGDTLDDSSSNLEWTTRVGNIKHSVLNELFKKRNPHRKRECAISASINSNLLTNSNVKIKVRDVVNNSVYIFDNLVQASVQLGLGIRGIKYALDADDGRVIKGFQIKRNEDLSEWKEPLYTRARNYKVTFSDGTYKICSAPEAAKYCGVTVTSLQRLIREGRNSGKNNVTVERIGTGNVLTNSK